MSIPQGTPIADTLLHEQEADAFAAVLDASVAVNRAGDRAEVEWAAKLAAWSGSLTEFHDPMFLEVAA